jgi:hypothetical protein
MFVPSNSTLPEVSLLFHDLNLFESKAPSELSNIPDTVVPVLNTLEDAIEEVRRRHPGDSPIIPDATLQTLARIQGDLCDAMQPRDNREKLAGILARYGEIDLTGETSESSGEESGEDQEEEDLGLAPFSPVRARTT